VRGGRAAAYGIVNHPLDGDENSQRRHWDDLQSCRGDWRRGNRRMARGGGMGDARAAESK
jgi:hypothetical protein